jgi:SH3 domain-containing YSC84-like protein 1
MKKLILLTTFAFLSSITLSFAQQEVVDRSANIIREFRAMPERNIPRNVLRNAHGLAIISVVKAGFIFSARGGKGLVVARTRHGWSGPSFVGIGGAGWGAQVGAQVTDFVLVLNSDDAVRAFSRDGNVTLGADASAAAGPVGRSAEAGITPKAAIYTYSKSKGLFLGASLEGAVLATLKNENAQYYRRPVTSYQILHGYVKPPRYASSLRAALGR